MEIKSDKKDIVLRNNMIINIRTNDNEDFTVKTVGNFSYYNSDKNIEINTCIIDSDLYQYLNNHIDDLFKYVHIEVESSCLSEPSKTFSSNFIWSDKKYYIDEILIYDGTMTIRFSERR